MEIQSSPEDWVLIDWSGPSTQWPNGLCGQVPTQCRFLVGPPWCTQVASTTRVGPGATHWCRPLMPRLYMISGLVQSPLRSSPLLAALGEDPLVRVVREPAPAASRAAWAEPARPASLESF